MVMKNKMNKNEKINKKRIENCEWMSEVYEGKGRFGFGSPQRESKTLKGLNRMEVESKN